MKTTHYTYDEANQLIHKEIIPLLREKFIEIYPDTFIKSTTSIKEEYENANGCMYSWYILICNNIIHFKFSPKYHQTNDEAYEGNYDFIKRFYKDIKNTKNFPKFLIENIYI